MSNNYKSRLGLTSRCCRLGTAGAAAGAGAAVETAGALQVYYDHLKGIEMIKSEESRDVAEYVD